MYQVFWIEIVNGTSIPNNIPYASDKLLDALHAAEILRARRRAGELISFIGIVSESPDVVGEMGVSDKLPPGYDWSKQDRAGKTRRR